jgi:hypothetical protein
MKALLVKLGVILIGLSIFGYAEVWGADWMFVGKTTYHSLYYDADGITRPSKNIVRVWEKIVYTDKGIIDMVGKFGSHYENLEYTLNLWEFNCLDKMSRLLTSISYSQKGEVLQSFNYDIAKWGFFPPDSIREALYEAVCK